MKRQKELIDRYYEIVGTGEDFFGSEDMIYIHDNYPDLFSRIRHALCLGFMTGYDYGVYTAQEDDSQSPTLEGISFDDIPDLYDIIGNAIRDALKESMALIEARKRGNRAK